MTDEQLVTKWQQRRDLNALSELRRRSARIVGSQVSKFTASPLPRSVLDSKADELFVDAASSYREGTGAKFSTHLFNHLKRLDRFVKQRGNIAYIPEARASKITVFQNAEKQLSDDIRRRPTDPEMADHLNWPVKEVSLMRKSVRRDIPASGIGGQHVIDITSARHQQLLHDIVHELTFDEKKVFNHLFGLEGKRKASSGRALSRLTGFSQPKVSLLRSSIAKKLEPHL